MPNHEVASNLLCLADGQVRRRGKPKVKGMIVLSGRVRAYGNLGIISRPNGTARRGQHSFGVCAVGAGILVSNCQLEAFERTRGIICWIIQFDHIACIGRDGEVVVAIGICDSSFQQGCTIGCIQMDGHSSY